MQPKFHELKSTRPLELVATNEHIQASIPFNLFI
jgi:hypothetical protein